MPQIIVMADEHGNSNGPAVMFTERVTARDFESGHFKRQLAERLEWAVGDAHAVEQQVAAVEQQVEREPRPTPSAEFERRQEPAGVS
jgi:hypothetical protein